MLRILDYFKRCFIAILSFLFRKRLLLGAVIFLGLSISILKLWHFQFDRDVMRKWTEVQSRWESEISSLNIDELYPKIREKEDFAKHPAVLVFLAQREKKLGSVHTLHLEGINVPRGGDVYALGVHKWFEDGKFENEQEAAEHVLELLDVLSEEVEPIEAALLERSKIGSKHDIELTLESVGQLYDFNRINALRKLHEFFLSRARLYVRVGNPDLVLEDLQRCEQLACFAGSERNLVSYSMYSALWIVEEQLIAEGFQNHLWEERHLDILRERRVEWNQYYQSVPIGELSTAVRVGGLIDQYGYDLVSKSIDQEFGYSASELPLYEDILADLIQFCAPKRMVEYEMSLSYEWVLNHLYPALRDETSEAEFRKTRQPDYGYFNLPEMYTTDWYRHGYRLSLVLEAKMQMSLAAIHLERYYLLQGCYPVSLEEMDGFVGDDFIDPLSGKLFAYSRRDNGKYDLSSVGVLGGDDILQRDDESDQRTPIYFFPAKTSP